MAEAAETLGDRLRQVRGALSQVDFASLLGADKNTIGRYERNERQPDVAFLLRIHSAFGTDLNWLLLGAAQKRPDSVAPPAAAGPVAKLDSEQLMEVIAAVEDFLAERQIPLNSDKKAKVIAALYEFAAEGEKTLANTPRAMETLIRLVS